MELGWPLPKRKELLARLGKEPGKTFHTVYFQNKRQDLPIRTVPIELPKYRLDNGRTRSAQAAYLAVNSDLPEDFFRKDQESEEAQKAQHQILRSMLGSGEKDLLRFFKKQDQLQPFILTDLGFVLNGNRRLCSFRELIAQDRKTYHPQFGNIDVVILPAADERDLDRLEAILQLTEDIKEPYKWTAVAYMLRARQQEHTFDEEELSQIYRIPLPEVRELLGMLSLAEEYLEDRGIPNKYEEVDEDEFAFRQLLRARSAKLKTADDRAVFQDLAFAAIEKWDSGRLYAVIPKIAENLAEIREAAKAEFKVGGAAKKSSAASLLGVKSVAVDPLQIALADESKRDAVRELVSDVIETADERGRETKRGSRLLSRVSKAADMLKGALSNWTPAKDAKPIKAKLAEIKKTVEAISKKLDGAAKD